MKETQKVPLRGIFGDVQLNVPKYQRAYSWDEKQVREFFQDLLYAVENYRDDDNKYHYLGTVVFEKDGTVMAPATEWDRYNVIDGQQRLITTTILARVISDYLSLLSNSSDNELSEKAEVVADNLEEIYIKDSNIQKLTPEDQSEDFYDKIVVDGKDPEDVVDDESPLVGHRIKDAINVFESELKSKLSDFDDPESGIEFLNEATQTLSNEFRLTPSIMEDMDEASRMFKIVNERGKEISTLDKIKSHLMYVATKTDDLEPEYVSSKINKAVRNVSKFPDSSDADLESLAQRHWVLFTGEMKSTWHKSFDTYEKDYRKSMSYVERLQELPWYASMERDSESLELFIRQYVNSLEEISESFCKYRFAEHLDRTGSLESAVSNPIHIMKSSGSSPKFETYVTGVLYVFTTTEDTNQDNLIRSLNEVVKPAIMYNQVMKNSGSYKRMLIKLGHQAFWNAWSDEPNSRRDEIFNGRTHANWDIPTTERALIEEIQSKIRNKNDEKNIQDSFENKLRESDVKDGAYTNGWGGVRSIDTIKMLFYLYEKSMRTNTGNVNMPSIREWCDKMELEHMVPRNPQDGEKISHHHMQINKLGNYIMLAPTDNKVASNHSYKYKKENMYDDLNLKMSDNLPPEATAENIDERSTEIINEIIDYLNS